MALEQSGKPTHGSAGMNLLVFHTKHLGDSRVVECTHLTAKDQLRDSKHFQRAVTSRMSAVIHSPALKSRKLNVVQLPIQQKLASGQWSSSDPKASFKELAQPERHKLDKKFQKMMLPNRGSHSWPSPTPATMYQGVASTEFLFKHLDFHDGQHLGDSWLSVLCGIPGSIIANKETGELLWTMTNSEHCFLAWRLKVHLADNGDRHLT